MGILSDKPQKAFFESSISRKDKFSKIRTKPSILKIFLFSSILFLKLFLVRPVPEFVPWLQLVQFLSVFFINSLFFRFISFFLINFPFFMINLLFLFFQRQTDQSHLSRGFLTLTGLQFRGHAMFSDKDVPLGNDTIEYGWLVEVQLGQLKWKMTPSQVSFFMFFCFFEP